MNEEKNTSPQNGENNNDSSRGKKAARLILIFIIVFVVVFCGIYFGIQLYSDRMAQPDADAEVTTTEATTSPQGLVDNPIDFDELQKQNDEIYAWLKVDGTNVDYPVVQNATNDEFYLKHSATDKSWSASGAIYTEMVNSKNFSDAVTVIYGHNGYGDTMFTTLHRFESKEFFDSHPYFYIYQPGRKLTYQIVSAFKYDDRHIMNSFNFANTAVLKEFQDYIKNPSSAQKNVRTKLDTQIDLSSNIVILSTCITNQKSSRYLICGVLTKDEKTN